MSKISQNWSENKLKIKEKWPGLSEYEIDQTKGDHDSIVMLIEHKFGLSTIQANIAVNELDLGVDGKKIRLLPESEEPIYPDFNLVIKKENHEDSPEYPNKLYEEDLPPDIKLKGKNNDFNKL